MYSPTTDLPRRHSLTIEDYYRMAEVGILGPDDRVELIDGEIIDMPPPGHLHSGTVTQVSYLLRRAVGEHAIVFDGKPAILGRYSAPQPDLALLEPRGFLHVRAAAACRHLANRRSGRYVASL